MSARSYFFLFLFALASQTALCGNEPKGKPAVSRVVAVIVDESTGEPLPGVEVRIAETGQKGLTNLDGEISFDTVLNSDMTLEVNYVSYLPAVFYNLAADNVNTSAPIVLALEPF